MSKERPIIFSGEMVRVILEGRKTQTRQVIKPQPGLMQDAEPEGYSRELHRNQCPYGVPGDRLWVRETLEINGYLDVYYAADGVPVEGPTELNGEYPDPDGLGSDPEKTGKVPSIFMPRWASRILLEITDVRVERVQDISLADIQAEGLFASLMQDPTDMADVLRSKWRDLWDSINAKRGWGWNKNPWLFVVTFKRVEE